MHPLRNCNSWRIVIVVDDGWFNSYQLLRYVVLYLQAATVSHELMVQSCLKMAICRNHGWS